MDVGGCIRKNDEKKLFIKHNIFLFCFFDA